METQLSPSSYQLCNLQEEDKKLISCLTESPALLHLYHQIITDQDARGFIEKVLPSSPPISAHYLPYHPVNKDSVTTLSMTAVVARTKNPQALTSVCW